MSSSENLRAIRKPQPTGCGRQNENVFEPSLGVEVL
jgi:hypothetical protein